MQWLQVVWDDIRYWFRLLWENTKRIIVLIGKLRSLVVGAVLGGLTWPSHYLIHNLYPECGIGEPMSELWMIAIYPVVGIVLLAILSFLANMFHLPASLERDKLTEIAELVLPQLDIEWI